MNEELNSYKTGVVLPAAQSVVTGGFFTGVLAGVVWLTETPAPVVYLLAGGLFVAWLAWLFLLTHWLQLVNYANGIQPVTRYEVLDEEEPEPELEQPSIIRVNLLEENGGYTRGQFIDLPCQPEQLRLLAGSVVAGGSLSEGSWCGFRKPFTKKQFHELRQALIKKGWLAWRNLNAPAQGVEVTHAGRRVFQHLVYNHFSPTEQDEDR
jgi:hypothetical protein